MSAFNCLIATENSLQCKLMFYSVNIVWVFIYDGFKLIYIAWTKISFPKSCMHIKISSTLKILALEFYSILFQVRVRLPSLYSKGIYMRQILYSRRYWQIIFYSTWSGKNINVVLILTKPLSSLVSALLVSMNAVLFVGFNKCRSSLESGFTWWISQIMVNLGGVVHISYFVVHILAAKKSVCLLYEVLKLLLVQRF